MTTLPEHPQIKAIETSYAGCRFRSRLEARWAVFFNTAGIPWQYEPQGFVIAGRPYLPDFYLPECGTWVEVKGHAGAVEVGFMREAAGALRPPNLEGPSLILLGDIPIPDKGSYQYDHTAEYPEEYDLDPGWWAPEPSGDDQYPAGFGHYKLKRRLWTFGTPLADARPGECVYDYEEEVFDEVLHAYQAARSARFEHGQKGAIR